MKKKFILFTLFLWTFLMSSVFSATLPEFSTPKKEVWHIIKFKQGALAMTAHANNAVCTSEFPKPTAAQLWKFEGNNIDGFTITNKIGQTLFYTGENQGDYVKATINALNKTKFKFVQRGDFWALTPFNNEGQSINAWGGISGGHEIRFYQSNDINAPLDIIPEEEFAKGSQLPIIPYPWKVQEKEGKLDFCNITTIATTNKEAEEAAKIFVEDVKRTTGRSLILSKDSKGSIQMLTNKNLGIDAYTLDVNSKGVTIKANSYGGFFYALQTLRQLLPTDIYGQNRVDDKGWTLPYVEIADEPLMQYRGFMLDVARHFFSVKEVKRLIDVASIYKLNRFHWHLTEDQGWRIEIPGYPRLTEVGSIRKGSLILNNPGKGEFLDYTEYGRGCFYTLDDLREVVAYAKTRNIEIMPEVDLPGHMVGAIAAYPEFSCNPEEKKEVRIAKGISNDVLNVGDDKVIKFLETVVSTIAEVFPYHYIHLGGDECPTQRWQNNELCKKRVKEEKLAGVHELQTWLVNHLGTLLHEKYGKEVVCWDELLAHWKSDYKIKPTIMAWRNINYAKDAANKGFKSIATPTYPFYFDLMQASAEQMEIDAPYIGGYGEGVVNNVPSVYACNPLNVMPKDKKKLMIGTQANLWTESCSSNIQAEYQLYPRLMAVAEVAWLPAEKKDFFGFYARLQNNCKILDAKKICYAKHYIEKEEVTLEKKLLDEAKLILEAQEKYAGMPGYVEHSEVIDNLGKAYEELKRATEDNLTLKCETLENAITAYKNEPICMPKEGQIYKLVSASTYYRKRFNGSALYVDGATLKLHYFKQIEPEELFVFEKVGDKFRLKTLYNNKMLKLGGHNQIAKLEAEEYTPFSITRPTIATKPYNHIPGVVNIKTTRGLITVDYDGIAKIGQKTEGALCMPGTWRIIPVNDFNTQLKGLIIKAQRIIEEIEPGTIGAPSQEAIQYLKTEVIEKGKKAIEKGHVSEECYKQFVENYRKFMIADRLSVIDKLSEDHYYYIRNAYFKDKYACVGNGNNLVPMNLRRRSDSFRWRLKKNEDGTVAIINKQKPQTAYVGLEQEETTVRIGKNYNWTLEKIVTDQGGEGIAIKNLSGKYSWYANPGVFKTILLKPFDWGASIWTFLPIEYDKVDGIEDLIIDEKNKDIYDLQGRKTNNNEHGVYIINHKKMLK